MALMRFGVRFGFAWSISATVPVTTGVAMLVPVRLRYGMKPSEGVSGKRNAASVLARVLPGAASDTVPTPGATRSGLAPKSMYVGPDELKAAIVSSARVSVPIVLEAPTVRTQGALPGAVIAPYCSWLRVFSPKLPAAATTVMPLSVSALVANVRESVQYDSYTLAPTDMFTTRML